ncbi:hypothetical protein BDW74DRAFT_103311 [Aspergillus multicolor]|uniref:uncharacterized protein n=1 Tax=Aspergillus multicolor TaxID=41759 RepID=UPI003CCCF834
MVKFRKQEYTLYKPARNNFPLPKSQTLFSHPSSMHFVEMRPYKVLLSLYPSPPIDHTTPLLLPTHPEIEQPNRVSHRAIYRRTESSVDGLELGRSIGLGPW